MEYAGWEAENGRPYYSNGQFTLAFGVFFGDTSMCGKGFQAWFLKIDENFREKSLKLDLTLFDLK